jgi:hypothetical protein
MNLYSVVRNRSIGSATESSTPRLVAGGQTINSFGDLKWSDYFTKIESLSENHSLVASVEGAPGVTWRVKRLPDYHANRVVFDSHAKEYVVVSNGKCTLDHSSPEGFRTSHQQIGEFSGCRECEYAPSEAIALRPFVANGKVALAWTYRAVNPCYLEAVPPEIERDIRAQFDAVMSRRRSARFIGRV